MTTEPVTVTSAPQAAAEARPKPKLDPRYIAPLFISTVLILAHLTVGILESPWQTATAIVVSLVAEAILGRLVFGKWPHLASAYVSGISVGILVRSPFYWPFAYCALISILSKYVLRVKGRHLWNPSNFGIAMTLIVAHDYMSTLSVQFGNSVGPMLVIWTLAFFIIWRLKRFHISATYAASFVLFAAVRSLITGESFWFEVNPILGPMYQLFTFFMVTDPKTTVHSKKGQMLVAFLVAAVECVLRLMHNIHAPYYALFIVGPIANLIEIWWMERKKVPPPAPAAVSTA